LPGLPVIIMTAYSDLDSAVSAFQGGAFEYLPKPFDLTKAVELIRRAVEESLREEVARAQAPVPEMLGQAPAMQDVFRAIGRLSQSNGADHRRVRLRQGAGGPCAAPPQPARERPSSPSTPRPSPRTCWSRTVRPRARRLHRRADHAPRPLRAGRGGTLFLDEIGDMPLRPADAPAARAVGRPVLPRRRPQPLKANVRVIAATHQNLEQRVRRAPSARPVPPPQRHPPAPAAAARAREDMPALAFFLQKSAKELGVEPKRLTDEAWSA
jgi:two-component system nitrogen regulation response regulator GlnG